MELIKQMENRIKKMKWYDLSMIKLAVFFTTLLIIKIWSGFRIFVLGFEWYWYLIVILILMIPITKKILLIK